MHEPVLIVEDDVNDIELIQIALEKCNLTNPVLIANTGSKALEMLENGPLPIVIVLDVKLPGMNGHEVLAAIRANPKMKTLPVVMLTSSRMEEDLNQAYAGGANSYVVKPLDFDNFRAAINDIGVYWGTHNISPTHSAI
jgi:CheY-like chemotaxis protein